MRLVAILAAYNEERFITCCIENLVQQGAEVYLIDNSSTDRTVEIAERYLHRGVIAIETLARGDTFSLRQQMARKETLALNLDADWLLHIDADEIKVPAHSGQTLAQALLAVDEQGYNAVNFIEYTFIPTREAPDHDHAQFEQTMRWYYPFVPVFPHRLNAWKRQDQPVELVASGGHLVQFPGLAMYPESFKMRHYLFLSVPQLVEKYVRKRFDANEVADGWHGWRTQLDPARIQLPSQRELRTYTTDDELEATNPRQRHYLADWIQVQATR